MTTRTEIRSILGDLAEVALPHLRGPKVTLKGGRKAIASVHDADIKHPLADTLKGFQRGGVAYALDTRQDDASAVRAILGHDMGLGKTIQAIAVLMAERTFPALIVVPPSLTINWVREFAKWDPSIVTHRIVGNTTYDLPAADVYIIGDSVVKSWVEPLISLDLRAIVVDEIQRMKSYKTQRTIATKDIARYVDETGVFLGLTGTLVKNNPMEAVSPLEIIGVFEPLFGDAKSFQERYYPLTGKDEYEREADTEAVIELHQRLLDTCYSRLEFEDVSYQLGDNLGERPVRWTLAVEMAGQAAKDYKHARDDLREFLAANGYSEGRLDKAMRAEALVRLNTLRRLIGKAKVPAVIARVKELVDDGEQVIVAAVHRDVTTAIAKAFDAPTIIGGMSVEAVEAGKADFQSGKAKVIVLNIEAGGTGHTLTAGRHVVFAEFGWTPADMEQVEARSFRIGQTRQVYSTWVTGANGEPTIDERLVDILNTKALVVGALNKGKAETMVSDVNALDALLDWAAS